MSLAFLPGAELHLQHPVAAAQLRQLTLLVRRQALLDALVDVGCSSTTLMDTTGL